MVADQNPLAQGSLPTANNDERCVRALRDDRTAATRDGRDGEVLAAHAADVVIFNLLTPLRYSLARQSPASRDEWQLNAQGDMQFEREDLAMPSKRRTTAQQAATP